LGDFVLILPIGRHAIDQNLGSQRRRRDGHCVAGEAKDIDAMEAADGSVASGGLPKADSHGGSSGHDRGRIDL
jgi:hypothetical protein